MNPGKWFIQLAGQLTAPLFARGQNIARLKAAKAQQEQAMNNFEYALMSASAEVSNAMMLYQKSTEKAVLLQEQVGKLATSVEITEELLKLGGMSTTYLEGADGPAAALLLGPDVGAVVQPHHRPGCDQPLSVARRRPVIIHRVSTLIISIMASNISPLYPCRSDGQTRRQCHHPSFRVYRR